MAEKSIEQVDIGAFSPGHLFISEVTEIDEKGSSNPIKVGTEVKGFLPNQSPTLMGYIVGITSNDGRCKISIANPGGDKE